MRNKLLIILAVLVGGYNVCFGVLSVKPATDFYTPMSTMVFSDRDYVMTSNTYAWLDMGDGAVCYETMMFLKFEDSQLPQKQCKRVWLRLTSGAGGTMGQSSRPLLVSVSPTDMDVMEIISGNISPRDFYANNNHVMESVANLFVYKDGICYWDITEIVNNWILFETSNGVQGYKNNGLAITGREDEGALDTSDNQHCGFWSTESVTGSDPMPHSAAPVLIFTDENNGFDSPWIPDWSSLSGYSCQFWTMSSADGVLSCPLVPDEYCNNSFGEPNLVWTEEIVIGGEEIINPFLTWHPYPDSSDDGLQPHWADGVYGGLYRGSSYSDYTLTANVPVGTGSQTVTVFVQYDWYNRGSVDVSIDGAVDITPENILAYEIADCGNGFNWYRSTKIFRVAEASGELNVVFNVSGDEPYIDSVSVTTAVNPPECSGLLRLPEDLDMNGSIDNFEFTSLAAKWLLGEAGQSDLINLAAIWLESSDYIWKY